MDVPPNLTVKKINKFINYTGIVYWNRVAYLFNTCDCTFQIYCVIVFYTVTLKFFTKTNSLKLTKIITKKTNYNYNYDSIKTI